MRSVDDDAEELDRAGPEADQVYDVDREAEEHDGDGGWGWGCWVGGRGGCGCCGKVCCC